MVILLLAASTALVIAYLWHASRAISTAPAEALNICQKDWTKEEITEAYRKYQTSQTNVKPYLFDKKGRRYVVAGGSGLVGGWIVQHLLMRGEDPAAIRIIDLSPTKRKEAVEANIDFVQTDVSDPDAVNKAFSKPWPRHVKSLPLTVFHCVAYINPSDRYPDFLPKYVKVNIGGTVNMLNAARAAGASCFVATSSASVGLAVPSYFPWPWQARPKGTYQFLSNAEPKSLDAPLESFGSCYAWSKAQAEKAVRNANDPKGNFMTGIIRPGHAIYGHGVENTSSITWDYLRRGNTPTWLYNAVTHFVHAQNVSIGHLAYENALVNKTHLGGKAYCVTDPNPPLKYGNLYKTLTTLAHPLTPVHFPSVSHILMLPIAHLIEKYRLLRVRYLKFLPDLEGDLVFFQPAVFNMSTLHVVYADTAAVEEIGYKAPITTQEGFMLAMLDWNQKVEEKTKAKVDQGNGGEVKVREGNGVPKAPNVH